MNLKINRLINCKLVRNFSLNTPVYKKKSYYDSLGISAKATQGDVKTAYYKLSKLYHPDLNKGNIEASEKFKDITAAYEVLGNVKTRKMYDRGLLVGLGGVQEVYESPEITKDDTFKHAPFYHHRNKPTKKSKKVNPEHYDIDEWTRAHYSTTFKVAHNKKQEELRFRTNTKEEERDTYSTWQIMSVIVFFSALGLYRATSKNSNYDRPHSVESSQGNDKS